MSANSFIYDRKSTLTQQIFRLGILLYILEKLKHAVSQLKIFLNCIPFRFKAGKTKHKTRNQL